MLIVAQLLVKYMLALSLVLGLAIPGVLPFHASAEQSAEPEAGSEREEAASRSGVTRSPRKRSAERDLHHAAVRFAKLTDRIATTQPSIVAGAALHSARPNLYQLLSVFRI
jgi:hypothetical protein